MTHRPENITFHLSIGTIEILQKRFDLSPFGTAGTGTRVVDDWPRHLGGKTAQVIFIGIGQRSNDSEPSFKKGLQRYHGAQFTGIEHVDEQGLNQVVLVMAQGQFGTSQAIGDFEQSLSPFARAQKTGIFQIRDTVSQGAEVGVLNVNLPSLLFGVIADDRTAAVFKPEVDMDGIKGIGDGDSGQSFG